MTNHQLRAGLYQRVSRRATATAGAASHRERSIAEQNAANLAAVAERGWQVADTFEDPGVSASRFTLADRPDYRRLRAALAAGALDVVIFWEPSRGDRKLATWAGLLDECRDRGVFIYITSHGELYDLRNARHWRTLAEDGVDSAAESEKVSQRVTRAHAANALAGRPHAAAPYGYTRVYDQATRELIRQEPDPVTGPVCASIIRDVAAGVPVSAIVRALDAAGIPAPRGGRWARSTVIALATSVTMIGKRKHNGGPLLEGSWPPVDPAPDFTEVFWQAHNLLRDDSRKTTRPGRHKHLLSYVAVCGTCGGPLGMRNHRGERRYYFCRTGGHAFARAEWLDELVTGLVLARLAEPGVYASLASDDEAAAAARARAAAERARLAELDDQVIAGTISVATFARLEPRITAAIAAAEREATSAATPPALRGLAAAGDIAARWDAMPAAARRDVIRALFERIAVAPADRTRAAAATDPGRVEVQWRHAG